MKASDTRRAGPASRKCRNLVSGSSEDSSESATTDEQAKSRYSPRCISTHRRCKRLRVRIEGTPKTVPFGLIRADYARSWIPTSWNYSSTPLGGLAGNTTLFQVPKSVGG
jgi:hypothetical protein